MLPGSQVKGGAVGTVLVFANLDRPPRIITLDRALDLVLRLHPAGEQARPNVDVAVARVEEARAPYLPEVTATGQYQRMTGNAVERPGVISSPNSPAARWKEILCIP